MTVHEWMNKHDIGRLEIHKGYITFYFKKETGRDEDEPFDIVEFLKTSDIRQDYYTVFGSWY